MPRAEQQLGRRVPLEKKIDKRTKKPIRSSCQTTRCYATLASRFTRVDSFNGQEKSITARATCGTARNESPEIACVSEEKRKSAIFRPAFPTRETSLSPPATPSRHFSSVKALSRAIRPFDNGWDVPRWKINREIRACSSRGGSRFEAKASKVRKQYGRMKRRATSGIKTDGQKRRLINCSDNRRKPSEQGLTPGDSKRGLL